MRIALVSDWYLPRLGGIEMHLSGLAEHLTAAGHDVEVITPTPGESRVDGIRVHRVRGPVAPRFGFVYTPSSLREIAWLLDAGSYDVAHCHVSIVSPAAIAGARSAVQLGIPTALTFHSVVPAMRLLSWGANVALGMSRWPVVFSAVSDRVARDVRPLTGNDEIEILHNGVDTAFWRSAVSPPRRDGRLELVSVMRLHSKKRPAALVGMMRAVASELPSGALPRLRIVGDGPERRALERTIGHLEIGDHIELLGRRSREEVRDVLASSDVFVLPTIRESFGLAALEARCAGLPVVAMAGSGVAEHIEPGINGLLARDDAELARHIAQLARDPGLRQRIAARNRASTPGVEWPTVIARHLALYERAVRRSGSARRSG